MRFKPGVRFDNLTAPMALVSLVADRVYRDVGADCEITSGSEGVHKGKPIAGDLLDPHPMGKALDFGVKERNMVLSEVQRSFIERELRARLGPDFVVIHEDVGLPNEHFHVQHGHIAPEV